MAKLIKKATVTKKERNPLRHLKRTGEKGKPYRRRRVALRNKGRDQNGKFIKGTRIPLINSRNRRKELRAVFDSVVTDAKFATVIEKLVRKARDELDPQAIKLLAAYGVGVPSKESLKTQITVPTEDTRAAAVKFYREVIASPEATMKEKLTAHKQIDLILGHVDLKFGTGSVEEQAMKVNEYVTAIEASGAPPSAPEENGNGNGTVRKKKKKKKVEK